MSQENCADLERQAVAMLLQRLSSVRETGKRACNRLLRDFGLARTKGNNQSLEPALPVFSIGSSHGLELASPVFSIEFREQELQLV